MGKAALTAGCGHELISERCAIDFIITPAGCHRRCPAGKDHPTMTAPSTHDTEQAAGLRHALAATLADEGAITSPHWREAFAAVPRHLFTPRFFLHAGQGGYRAVDSSDPE